MADLLLAAMAPGSSPSSKKKTAGDASKQPVSAMHWLLVGGTGKPPSSHATLMRMARQRSKVTKAGDTWKTARAEAKDEASKAKKEIDAKFQADFGEKPKKTELLAWHRGYEAAKEQAAKEQAAKEGTEEKGAEKGAEDKTEDKRGEEARGTVQEAGQEDTTQDDAAGGQVVEPAEEPAEEAAG